MKTLKSDMSIYTNFLTMISVSLFCCCKKVIRKNLMKHHYQKKKISTVTKYNTKDITHTGYTYAKKVCKDFEKRNLGKYHDLWLLADFFNNFCNVS